METKLSEILKQQGLFAQDIKARIKNKQIFINGEPISEDVDVDCATIINKEGVEVVKFIEAGDFLFSLLHNNDWAEKILFFGIENLFDTNIENDLTLHLKGFIFIVFAKKRMIVLQKKENK